MAWVGRGIPDEQAGVGSLLCAVEESLKLARSSAACPR